VIANRTTDMFAFTAKKSGKVIHKDDNGIIVEYSDGETKGVTLGRVYGKAEGSVYPHDIVSNLNIGDDIKKGNIVAYNTGFFEPDIIDSKKIIMKNSLIVRTALYESLQTFEDSSSISKELSAKLKSKTTKLKSVVVDFNQNILNVVKIGSILKPKDIIFTIEDAITSTSTAFDDESLSVLQDLSKQTIKSKYEGTIDRIEVLYHGSKDDMSASIKSLADKSDRLLSSVCKSSNRPVITGQVNSDYRVNGVPLSLDKAEIKIYITIETNTGVGDKGVFANQMKSVFSEVLDYDMHTESGDKIDAIFGYKSIMARIVLSPFIIGTTTTLLKVIGKKACQIYRG